LLEKLDIQGVQFSGEGFADDISTLKYLQTLLAKGSNLSTYKFSIGSDLQHIELPVKTATLWLRNNLFFDNSSDESKASNLTIESYANFSNLFIAQCPLIDTFTLVENIRKSGALLSEVRLPDIKWTIVPTAENCDLDTSGAIPVVNDILALAYLKNVNGTYNADGSEYRYVKDTINNDHIAGTVIINNDNCLVNDYMLQTNYAAKFPYLKFEYTNANNIAAGYSIRIRSIDTDLVINNEADPTKDSVTLSINEALGFNLAEHLQDNCTIPTKISTTASTFEFKGWSRTKHQPSADDAVIAENLDYPMTYDETTGKWTISNAPTSLTEADYTDHAIDIYPVFKQNIRQYTISFYSSLAGVTPKVLWTTHV
jgi:hypothetical protein